MEEEGELRDCNSKTTLVVAHRHNIFEGCIYTCVGRKAVS